MPIAATRALLSAALSGAARGVEVRVDPVFGFDVPVAVPGVDTSLLDPRSTWADPDAYDDKARYSPALPCQLRGELAADAGPERRGRRPGREGLKPLQPVVTGSRRHGAVPAGVGRLDLDLVAAGGERARVEARGRGRSGSDRGARPCSVASSGRRRRRSGRSTGSSRGRRRRRPGLVTVSVANETPAQEWRASPACRSTAPAPRAASCRDASTTRSTTPVSDRPASVRPARSSLRLRMTGRVSSAKGPSAPGRRGFTYRPSRISAKCTCAQGASTYPTIVRYATTRCPWRIAGRMCQY